MRRLPDERRESSRFSGGVLSTVDLCKGLLHNSKVRLREADVAWLCGTVHVGSVVLTPRSTRVSRGLLAWSPPTHTDWRLDKAPSRLRASRQVTGDAVRMLHASHRFLGAGAWSAAGLSSLDAPRARRPRARLSTGKPQARPQGQGPSPHEGPCQHGSWATLRSGRAGAMPTVIYSNIL